VRSEGLIFAALAVFFGVVATIYGILSHEVIGTTALILTGGLSLLIAFYGLVTHRRIGDRPEDRADGEIADSAGEYGFYSPHSWWPLPTAASAAVTTLGFAFGWWISVIGVVALMMSAVGFVFEYYRGYHAEG